MKEGIHILTMLVVRFVRNNSIEYIPNYLNIYLSPDQVEQYSKIENLEKF